MELRHEYKHKISRMDLLLIRQRLRAVAPPDPHAMGGSYRVRSLYFDTPSDQALREKLCGVSRREKFRIRYYNGDLSSLHLEKKSKRGSLGGKQSAPLTVPEAEAILQGELDWMMGSGRPLLQELYFKMQTQLLRPKTIVDYTREPYIYPPGNVRITLDYDIRTGLRGTDLLHPCLTVPAGQPPILLEVKWDAFLPGVIRDAVQLGDTRTFSFSKYAQCRIYG